MRNYDSTHFPGPRSPENTQPSGPEERDLPEVQKTDPVVQGVLERLGKIRKVMEAIRPKTDSN